MRISTSLSHGIRMTGSPEKAAELMKRAGFDGIDLSMCEYQTEPEKLLSPEWREHVLRHVRAARENGLAVAQCHLPYRGAHLPVPGDGTKEGFAAFMLPMYERAIVMCGEAGCPVAVMHPYFRAGDPDDTLEGNLRILERLIPLAERNDVRIALENVYGETKTPGGERVLLDGGCSRPEGILRVLNALDSDSVGACLDTGHANIFRVDIAGAARAWGKKLIALHINGNAGKDEHVIPYSMSGWCEEMDFHALSRALGETGYTGYYNLELNSGSLPASCAGPYYAYAAAVARALADETEN